MLRSWILNPNLAEMEIEEKFRKYASETHTDRYATAPYLNVNQVNLVVIDTDTPIMELIILSVLSEVTLLQLEKTYGKSREAKDFIQELVRGSLVAI